MAAAAAAVTTQSAGGRRPRAEAMAGRAGAPLTLGSAAAARAAARSPALPHARQPGAHPGAHAAHSAHAGTRARRRRPGRGPARHGAKPISTEARGRAGAGRRTAARDTPAARAHARTRPPAPPGVARSPRPVSARGLRAAAPGAAVRTPPRHQEAQTHREESPVHTGRRIPLHTHPSLSHTRLSLTRLHGGPRTVTHSDAHGH